jgi:Tol biopolymer transport system component
MNDRLDLERLVTDWLIAEAAPAGSERVLAATQVRVAATSQDRYVTQRLFGDQFGRSHGLRLAMIATLLTILLLGAVLLVSGALRQDPPIPRGPAANGWVAFQGNGTAGADLQGTEISRGGHGDIYVARSGVPARRIIGSDDERWHQMCPTFSVDGKRLAFVELDTQSVPSTPPPRPEAEAEGSVEVPVAAPPSGPPHWRISVVEIGDDGNPTNVVVEAEARSSLASCVEWSPDGRRLAYVASSEGGGHGLLVVTLDGTTTLLGQPVSLFDGGNYTSVAAAFAWSPDGSTIALAGDDRLWLLPVDGGAPRSIPGQEIRQVTWSPDGTMLALGIGPDVRVVTTDGELVATIVSGEGDAAPPAVAWSPDGRWLAYMDGDDLVTVAPDGTGREARPSGVRELLTPLQEDPPGPSVAGWSPDGQQVLVITGAPDVAGAILTVPAFTDAPGTIIVGPTLAITSGSATWQPVR